MTDHEVLLEQLVTTVRQVGILEKQVANQRQIVELLEHYGRKSVAAREALAMLEREYHLNSARRNQIRLLLEA